MDVKLIQGQDSCIADGIVMKLYSHTHNSMIHIKFKFHEVPIVGYLVTANFMDFKSIQGDNSCNMVASPSKIDVRQRLIVINLYFKFHRILFTDYLVKLIVFKLIQGQWLMPYCCHSAETFCA